ncbi:MAG: kynureninase [bacterium]|nr:kynureninase [Candidatus Kapabacteria bacterium]
MSTTTSDTAFDTSREFARDMDARDPLRDYRTEYHIPLTANGDDVVYLTGNSLGLQPKGVRAAVDQELTDWAKLGVEGHFEAANPWYGYHEVFREPAATLVGARPGEVVVMNTLTTNLHLMMVSFYRPTRDRYKILVEENAFPSDQYAVASQARFHGYDPHDAIVAIGARQSETETTTEAIEQLLAERGSEFALILLGGVNYYSGQAFDMARITAAARAQGCVVGFDLAHAAGNLQLNLHDWDVDFAVWCTYKYLNSGPGGVAGCFVHERHAFEPDLPRFAGWWGTEPQTRFEMRSDFVPQKGAAGWQLSNAQILPMAAHRVALDLFTRARMPALRAKSELLTGYMEHLLNDIADIRFEIITPSTPVDRGCQLSIRLDGDARRFNEALAFAGVVADYRPPDVIRVAPVPMYNTFDDVWRFVEILKRTT